MAWYRHRGFGRECGDLCARCLWRLPGTRHAHASPKPRSAEPGVQGGVRRGGHCCWRGREGAARPLVRVQAQVCREHTGSPRGERPRLPAPGSHYRPRSGSRLPAHLPPRLWAPPTCLLGGAGIPLWPDVPLDAVLTCCPGVSRSGSVSREKEAVLFPRCPRSKPKLHPRESGSAAGSEVHPVGARRGVRGSPPRTPHGCPPAEEPSTVSAECPYRRCSGPRQPVRSGRRSYRALC